MTLLVFNSLELYTGKEWRQKQITKIIDRVYHRVKIQPGAANLTFEDLYIVVLLLYNDINKVLPGPHFDPPSKEKVREIIKNCDMNVDGEIDREEFCSFVEQMTADTITYVSQKLIVTLVVAPTVAVATKKATEGVPGVGRVVQRLPNSAYASLVTLAAMWFQNMGQHS
ncbi:hypothetical protein Lal_00008269 [Lupinus albus]|uniref:Putative EF-hand domain pair protein n=1 Tax=Lupinus albus TaxID=3870 RepID=A0A6A4PPC1_LUPAL|nr:putative EF-hand domain pair protein [Lupinus albus]KAF1868462.1 hypothetical protein Lal_00008269 [Lupinus albus]